MIYSVEDDAQVREMVLYALAQSGIPARGFADGASFWAALGQQQPDLVLLDIMLPGEDGISILRRLRAQAATRQLPVILLTAKGAEMERVMGLNEGADDYIAKPFSVLELVARIKALLRRTVGAQQVARLVSPSVTMDIARHAVTVGDAALQLTLKEFELLAHLMQHAGMALSREQLLDAIWDVSYAGNTRTVDVHIQTLRQKLGPAAVAVETVRGIGYRFTEDVVCEKN